MGLGINRIYQGDCLELMDQLEDNSIDCIVTSPPYNKQNSKCHGYLKRKIAYGENLDSVEESVYQTEQVRFLDSCFRVLKDSGSLFYNHKVRFFNGTAIHPMSWILRSKLNLRQEIIWNRKKALNIGGTRFWQIEERIYWLNRSSVQYNMLESKHALMKSVWEISPQEGTYHPAAFPITIPTRILYSVLPEDSKDVIVLDPYSGSGTTCLAAKELGYAYIGFEKDPTYVEKSLIRLGNPDIKDLQKIKTEKELHVVKHPYSERKKTSLTHYLKTEESENLKNDPFFDLS